MVGRRSAPFWDGLFSGALAVSFRENSKPDPTGCDPKCSSFSIRNAPFWPELQQKRLPSSYMPQPTLLRHHFELQIFWATAFGGIKEPCDTYVVLTEPCCPEELATLGMHADAGPGRTTELAVWSRLHHFQLSGTQQPSSRKNTYTMDAHGPWLFLPWVTHQPWNTVDGRNPGPAEIDKTL